MAATEQSLGGVVDGGTGDGDFRRDLGLFSASCVVIGAIIGIGIFFTPKDVAIAAGSSSAAMYAWMAGGVIAVLGALTFAELGGAYARTGGQFDILRDAYGALVGFVYVFCNATAVQAGAIAVIASISASNLLLALGWNGDGNGLPMLLATGMIGSLMWTNAIGVRWGALTQNITVVAKVATLLVIIGLAVFTAPLAGMNQRAAAAPAAEAAPPSPPTAPPEVAASSGTPSVPMQLMLVFAALVPVLFSFGGWQHALWIGGEVRNPRWNVPASILIGVGVVTVVYLAVNWAYLELLGYQGVTTARAIAADSVATRWPNVGSRLIAAAIAFSGFGVLNAQLLSGPRLLCGMARQGFFFQPFTRLHARYRTPTASIFLLGGLGLFFLWVVGTERTDQLTNGVVMVDTTFFIATGMALVVLRRRSRGQDWPIRMPLFPLIPVLFALAETCVLVGAFTLEKYRLSAFIGALWIAGAFLCYWFWFRQRRHPATEAG